VQDTCGGIFDVDGKERQIEELENQMGRPGFWDRQEKARKTTTELSRLKQSIAGVKNFQSRLDDVQVMLELVDESESGAEDSGYILEISETAANLHAEIDDLEISSFLNGPHDTCNAIVSIHAGAGGTEACDWAEMLLRMYSRWAERNGYKVVIQELQPGEEAGISRVTFFIEGDNAYGYGKAERGVHRLVRISPFDANKRRHTSFCAVDVIAEVKDDIDLDVDEGELRIDTYRSSGKGGQHVNKTDSAVRLTHLPTGIVVACQNERSQHKNKATAMKILKSRIYEKLADEKRAEMEKFYGEKNEIGWGNQIRSYVFQPYQMVKDLRTSVETSNVQQVMDGDIDRFIHAWLRAGEPSSRNKDISLDD
jgi:peptide chain release factor 2